MFPCLGCWAVKLLVLLQGSSCLNGNMGVPQGCWGQRSSLDGYSQSYASVKLTKTWVEVEASNHPIIELVKTWKNMPLVSL